MKLSFKKLGRELKSIERRLERQLHKVAHPRPLKVHLDSFAPAASSTARPRGPAPQRPMPAVQAPAYDEAKAGKVLDSLYRGILGREPDESGRAAYLPLVQEGSLARVVNAMVGSVEFRARALSTDPQQLSQDLYRGILGRDADPEGHVGTVDALMRGDGALRVFDMVTSPENIARLEAPEPPPAPQVPEAPPSQPTPPAIPRRGPELSTVPDRPEYATAPIDRSSPSSAALSAARWVKEKYPDLFARADDRQVTFEIMTHVIGALRAAGFDAHRVVNHPSRAVGDGWRYGSDAAVINGQIFDVYRGIGDENAPQAMDAGPYGAGRLRE